MYSHGMSVQCCGLVGNVHTDAAQRPVEGAGEQVMVVVVLIVAANDKFFVYITVKACPKVSCDIPCVADVLHSCEFEGIPTCKNIEVFPNREIKSRR